MSMTIENNPNFKEPTELDPEIAAVDKLFDLAEIIKAVVGAEPYNEEETEEAKLDMLDTVLEAVNDGEASMEDLELLNKFMGHVNGFARGAAIIVKPLLDLPEKTKPKS